VNIINVQARIASHIHFRIILTHNLLLTIGLFNDYSPAAWVNELEGTWKNAIVNTLEGQT